MVEQRLDKALVGGSNPPPATKQNMNMTTQTQSPTPHVGRAAERRMDRAIKKQALATLVTDNDLQFVYLRNLVVAIEDEHGWNEDVRQVWPKGGMVIAYKVPRGGGQVVEIATSICNNKDIFDKLEGKFMAANSFASGAKVKIKLAEASRWGQQLVQMFSTV